MTVPAVSEAPRPTRVLRPGPKRRGGWANHLFGWTGLLIVVVSVAMFKFVPQDPAVLPEFRVVVTDTDYDIVEKEMVDPPEFQFTDDASASSVHEFQFDVTRDNVHTIVYRVTWTDDLAGSLPDRFRVEVVRPDGTLLGSTESIDGSLAEGNQTAGTPPGWQAGIAVWSFNLEANDRPADQVVKGLAEDETSDQVVVRLRDDAFRATQGTWTLKVSMDEAGDCPQPLAHANPDGAVRTSACHTQQSDGEDFGNLFKVTQFKYTYFSVDVEELA